MRDVPSIRIGSRLLAATIMACVLAAATPPAWAANLCLSDAAGNQFVLRGMGTKIGKKKSKPVSGYVIVSGGSRVRPVSGACVTDALGTRIAAGFAEYHVGVASGGAGGSTTTTFHQVILTSLDGKLSVGTAGPDCLRSEHSDGTASGGCEDVSVIDCKTVADIP